MTIADLRAYDMRWVPNLEALCDLVAEQNERGRAAVLLAGGTDWMVEQEMRAPLSDDQPTPVVVDISRLHALREISMEGTRLRIGAAVTYLELRRHEAVLKRAPLLARMSRDVGAIQIQARGTLGGNVATGSPAADGVAALAAYDAKVLVHSVRGPRSIPFADLQVGYKKDTRAKDEVIVAFDIELPPPGPFWMWRKVGTRRAQSISKVALAAVADVRDGRVRRMGCGMASVAPVTARLEHVRRLATSKPMEEIRAAELDAAVDADVNPIDDVRSTRDYRRHVAKAITREWFRMLRAPV